MATKALDRAYGRIARRISREAMSVRELIASGVASREIVVSYIRDAKERGSVSMSYRTDGEPEYRNA